MIGFDFTKNKNTFENFEYFTERLNQLVAGAIPSICGQIEYEDFGVPIDFKIKYDKDEKMLVLWCCFNDKEIVGRLLLTDVKGCSSLTEENIVMVLDRIEWFFGKCPDDDTFADARRIAFGRLFLNHTEKPYDSWGETACINFVDGGSKKLAWFNTLFGQNI